MLNQFNASLWGDEAWAATLAVKPLTQIITIVARDTSPPLYYILDHLWMRVFGTSEVSIRTLTFLFFLGTVFTTYLIGKHLWDKKTGLFAALLVLGNPFIFKAAFEGRMYALLALTCALSMYFYLKEKKWAHILSTAAALYTHHFAIFAVLTQASWHLVKNWGKPSKNFIKSFSNFFIVALLYLPWLYPLYYQTSLVGSGFWLARPTLKTILETTKIFLLGFGKSNPEKLALASLSITLFLRKWSEKKAETLFSIIWFLLPITFTFIISQFFQPIFFDRYLLFAIPGGLLVLSSNKSKISRLSLTVFIIIMLAINLHYFSHPTKQPFRDFSILIKEKINNHDFLLNYPAGAHHLFESKYYGLKAPLYVPKENLPFYVGTALMEKEDTIRQIPADVTRLGVITSGSLDEIQINGFEKLISFELGDLKFARFVPYQ